MKFLKFNVIPGTRLHNLSSFSGFPVLEARCDSTQQLQMEVGSLGSMVVYGEIVDDHVIVNGRSL